MAFVVTTPFAYADPDDPPTLLTGTGTQRGANVYATKHGQAHGLCWGSHADGPGEYPAAIRHDGTALRFRVPTARRPESATVWLARAGTPYGALGPVEPLATTLSPVVAGHRVVAWNVTTAASGYGDLHVDLNLEWPKGSCGKDSGGYRYHVLAVPP